MGSARIALGMVFAAIAACRPADPAAPPESTSAEAELERARATCDRGEPGGCDRVELERARRECKAGAPEGCEHYDVVRSICLEHPEGPLCDALRRHGDLPAEPPPLVEAFGCRTTEALLGPTVVVCLAADRVAIRDANGVWEQWRVERWGREDTAERAIRVATLVDGAPLWLTSVEVEVESGLCAPVVVRSTKRRAPRDLPPAACTSTAHHVVGVHGLLRATLGARDPEAEAALARLPTVEELCDHADACERALAGALPRPVSLEGEEVEIPGPGPRTLRQCHARLWSAATAEQALGLTLPAACERIRGDLGDLPSLPPPVEWGDSWW